MQRRIICPHCHSPIDPFEMDVASFAEAPYRICPDCDEPIAVINAEAIAHVAISVPCIDGTTAKRDAEDAPL